MGCVKHRRQMNAIIQRIKNLTTIFWDGVQTQQFLSNGHWSRSNLITGHVRLNRVKQKRWCCVTMCCVSIVSWFPFSSCCFHVRRIYNLFHVLFDLCMFVLHVLSVFCLIWFLLNGIELRGCVTPKRIGLNMNNQHINQHVKSIHASCEIQNVFSKWHSTYLQQHANHARANHLQNVLNVCDCACCVLSVFMFHRWHAFHDVIVIYVSMARVMFSYVVFAFGIQRCSNKICCLIGDWAQIICKAIQFEICLSTWHTHLWTAHKFTKCVQMVDNTCIQPHDKKMSIIKQHVW